MIFVWSLATIGWVVMMFLQQLQQLDLTYTIRCWPLNYLTQPVPYIVLFLCYSRYFDHLSVPVTLVTASNTISSPREAPLTNIPLLTHQVPSVLTTMALPTMEFSPTRATWLSEMMWPSSSPSAATSMLPRSPTCLRGTAGLVSAGWYRVVVG